MDKGDGGGGDRESAVMGGGGAWVASGGVRKSDDCRIPGVTQELWEDLPYSFSFFLNKRGLRGSLA